MNMLITAIGKRVQLIKHLKKTFKIIGVDCGDLVPASFFVDKFYKVPRFSDNGYIERILKICRNEHIDVIIPLYEKEFSMLNEYRKLLENQGTLLLLSSTETIDIFNSKLQTYNFFIENNIPTPKTYTKEQIEEYFDKDLTSELNYPLIVKPDNGMGSENVYIANSPKELSFFCSSISSSVIQEFVKGIEYTVDTLCDLNGNAISIVPRQRIETRSGEVTKTKTEKNSLISDSVLNICRKIKFIGPVTIQCIINGNNISFIEINPRFGGGVPLTFESGVDYGQYIKMMIEGKKIEPVIGKFSERVMLRYDEAVII